MGVLTMRCLKDYSIDRELSPVDIEALKEENKDKDENYQRLLDELLSLYRPITKYLLLHGYSGIPLFTKNLIE